MYNDSGDERNRARIDALFRSDPYVAALGAQLVGWAGGEATLRWVAREVDRNFVGVVHGGALFSVADGALAVASNSWGRVCVALSVEAQFLAPVPRGKPLLATARERSRARRTGSYLIEVAPEAEPEVLVASFQGMVYRTDHWHLGADAWSETWKTAH